MHDLLSPRTHIHDISLDLSPGPFLYDNGQFLTEKLTILYPLPNVMNIPKSKKLSTEALGKNHNFDTNSSEPARTDPKSIGLHNKRNTQAEGSTASVHVILIAGSKKIRKDSDGYWKEKMELAKAIGIGIVSKDNWILLNGGAFKDSPGEDSTAVDYLACEAAKEELEKRGSIDDRIITVHPFEESPRPLHEIGKVVKSKRATSALRRFDLVAKADAIITIEGGKGTKDMIELAMALGKPVLPIRCTDGTSEEAWKNYEDEIMGEFGIEKESDDYDLLTKGLEQTSQLSESVIEIINKRLRPNCFVAMSFDEESREIYDNAIAPALKSSGFNPVRADYIAKVGNILDHMIESIRNSSAFLADISRFNPNVMYELGMAESLGKPVIIIYENADAIGSDQMKYDDRSNIPIDIIIKRRINYNRKKIDILKDEISKFSSSISSGS